MREYSWNPALLRALKYAQTALNPGRSKKQLSFFLGNVNLKNPASQRDFLSAANLRGT
jgi:hypothetical protein